MSVKTISKLLIVLGLIVVFLAMGMDTTVEFGRERVHNLPLAAQQQNMLIIGGFVFISGIILFALAKLKQTSKEEAAERAEKEALMQRADDVIARTGNAMSNSTPALLWGVITLITLAYLMIMTITSFALIGELSLLNDDKINELISKVTPIVESLASRFPGEEKKKGIQGVDEHRESDQANFEIDSVTIKTYPGVTYNEWGTPNEWGGRGEIYSPKGKLEILEKYRLDSSLISHYNIRICLRLIGSLVGFILGAYLFYRLVRYRCFGIKSNLFFLLVSAPIFLTSTSLMLMYPTLTITSNEHEAITSLLISFIWICVAYPASYVLTKKQGGLINLLFP